MPIIKQIKFIDRKKFAKTALDKNSKNFVVYVVALETLSESAKMIIHFLQIVQITSDNLM